MRCFVSFMAWGNERKILRFNKIVNNLKFMR